MKKTLKDYLPEKSTATKAVNADVDKSLWERVDRLRKMQKPAHTWVDIIGAALKQYEDLFCKKT